jgi:hypothetical protein
VQAYTSVRAFSWQLRLSPFPFEALLVAIVANDDSTLRDEVHICLLRALAWHESKTQRLARKLPLATLDTNTWKDHLWEYLRYLHCFDWWQAHVIHRRPEVPFVDLRSGQVNPSRVVLETKPNVECEMPVVQNEDGKAAWLKYVLLVNKMDRTPDELIMREYDELEVLDRFSLLNLLCDVLLDQPHVKDEIEGRVNAGHWHAGIGGEGGVVAMLSEETRAARKAAEASGTFEYELYSCMLCTQMEGQFVRCEACSAPYHLRCLGLRVAPNGAWMCPECRAGGRGECAGVRIPMAAMQPGRIPLYLLHGNVLRVPHPGQKIIEEDADMVDCGLEWLQGDAAMEAVSIAKRKGGQDGCHATALDALVAQCSSAAAGGPKEGEDGYQPEQIAKLSCTPWTYSNSYRCAQRTHTARCPQPTFLCQS